MKNCKHSVLLFLIVGAMGLSLCSCKNSQTSGKLEKSTITIGNWPDETQPDMLAAMNKTLDSFRERHPEIIVNTDTYAYSTNDFIVKASAKQLPTLYNTWFTEIKKIITSGYAADITDSMKKYGLTQALNPSLLELVTDDNGRIYGVPQEAYAQGLYINKKLFKDAGLLNSDGSPKIPTTYEEVGEFGKIIKEKTGVAGFIMPTTNNVGGWNFMNIAWSYGVDFMEQQSDGKWKATFNTPEFKKALQLLYDYKWKYDALSDNTVIDVTEQQKMFSTYQGAMMFCNPPSSQLVTQYGMNKDDIYATTVPSGDKGKYALMGGVLNMISYDATQEQIDACFTWMTEGSSRITLDDATKSRIEESYKADVKNGSLIMPKNAFDIWVNQDRITAVQEIAKKYTNVNESDYENYFGFKGVTIKPEESVCCQELYAVLDGCIQEVITNKNVNINTLTSKAVNDFQANHLDKLDQ